MVNTLGYYNPVYYAQQSLAILQNALGMASRVYMGYDQEHRTFGKGDTINIRRPTTFVVNDAPSTPQDLNPDSLQLVLSSWKEVKYKLTDKDLALTQERMIQDHISPAAYALANYIDQDLAALAYQVGPIVKAGAATYATTDITATQKKLFNNQCPLVDPTQMSFMIGGAAQKDLLDTSNFGTWSGAGGVGATSQITGVLGQRYGFNFFANQNVNQMNYASFTFTTPTVNGAQAKGVTSLPIAATMVNGNVIPAGFAFTIAGDTQVYSVTTSVTVSGTAGGTVTISPPLRQAHSNGDAITVDASTPITGLTTKDQNIAFHRNAFAMAFGKLPDYGEYANRLGMQVASIQDPVTGLALRARIYAVPDSSDIRVAIDALWGKQTLQPNYACRLLAA